MSQHDYIIDNQLAPAFRSDLNAALNAIVSTNSGVTAPTTTYANMLWYDTTNDLLKMRNESNSAFITLGTIDQTNSVFNPNFLPATQAEAEAGTNNVKGVTPLRVAQAIATLSPAFVSGVNIQAFTASGTYTPTSGYKWGIAFVTGGGGGGNGNAFSGGGGAGGTSIGVLNLTTLGAVSVTIGAGGSANNSGGSSTLSTLSGGGGSQGQTTSGGSGGSSSGGALNIQGGSGQYIAGSSAPGIGGGSFWGSGNNGAGRAFGAGGGGNSGAGKEGVVMVMEFK
jgi:hypothetical protein